LNPTQQRFWPDPQPLVERFQEKDKDKEAKPPKP